MLMHETWCASRYRGEDGAQSVCDCNAAERAAKEAKKTHWRGELPDQFCEKCEGSPVRLIIVRPRPEQEQSLRMFAACFAPMCAHIRELDPAAIV